MAQRVWDVFAALCLVLPLQLGLGSALCRWRASRSAAVRGVTSGARPGHRRRRARWSRCARTLWRAALGALLLALGVRLARFWTGGLPHLEPLPMLAPGLGTLVVAAIVSGAGLGLHAGRLEALGRLRAARVEVGLGGRAMFLGIAAEQILLGAAFLALDGPTRAAIFDRAGASTVTAAVCVIAIGTAAFCALLAALTRKPRPAIAIATALWLTAHTLLAALG